MSNFVVAKGVERLDKDGVERVVGECKAVQGGRGMISEYIERAAVRSLPGIRGWVG